jgi:hypothetical protein
VMLPFEFRLPEGRSHTRDRWISNAAAVTGTGAQSRNRAEVAAQGTLGTHTRHPPSTARPAGPNSQLPPLYAVTTCRSRPQAKVPPPRFDAHERSSGARCRRVAVGRAAEDLPRTGFDGAPDSDAMIQLRGIRRSPCVTPNGVAGGHPLRPGR